MSLRHLEGYSLLALILVVLAVVAVWRNRRRRAKPRPLRVDILR